MNILQRFTQVKELWNLAMPQGVPIPPDRSFLIWLNSYDDDQMQHAIMKTGAAMVRKKQADIPIEETDAARYCSTCLKSTGQAKGAA